MIGVNHHPRRVQPYIAPSSKLSGKEVDLRTLFSVLDKAWAPIGTRTFVDVVDLLCDLHVLQLCGRHAPDVFMAVPRVPCLGIRLNDVGQTFNCRDVQKFPGLHVVAVDGNTHCVNTLETPGVRRQLALAKVICHRSYHNGTAYFNRDCIEQQQEIVR